MSANDRNRLNRERQNSGLRDALGLFAVTGNDSQTLAQRTRSRLRQWEQLRQQNLEAIASEALSYLAEGGSDVQPDADWLAQFLELAADIHAPALRSLWARILAAEASRPGSFTLKTLTRLRQLTQRDATLLRHALALRCRLGENSGLQILIGWGTPLPWWQLLAAKSSETNLSLARFSLPPSAVLALEELGLLYNEEFGAGPFNPGDEIALTIASQRLVLVPKKQGTRLTYLRFSAVGEELAQLIKVPSHPSYVSELQDALTQLFEVRG